MRVKPFLLIIALFGAIVSTSIEARAIDPTLEVLAGLAPFNQLLNTPQGLAALDANHRVTFDIQSGSNGQPLLLPFALQQAQALSDAFITSDNAAILSDGLGSGLGIAYRTVLDYKAGAGRKGKSTGSLPGVQGLLLAATRASAIGSGAAKYFLANGGVATKDGCKAVAVDGAAALASKPGTTTDVYGKAYGLRSGAPGANPCGNSRPFQTDYRIQMYAAGDFWGVPSSNDAWLLGPVEDLRTNPSFPSGHTTYGYTQSLLLGIFFPQRYPQMVTRAAEYGNDRIVIGAHYAMDVLAGRTIALYVLAHVLSDDAGFKATNAARKELLGALDAACKRPGASCALDSGRFEDSAKNAAFYESTQTYGLPVVYANTASETEDAGTIAPEAGYLLTAAFPSLSLKKADEILTATEGPGGGFLDNGSAFGFYSRIDLYKAVIAAQRLANSTASRRSPAPAGPGRW
jgi:hypothetical protein